MSSHRRRSSWPTRTPSASAADLAGNRDDAVRGLAARGRKYLMMNAPAIKLDELSALLPGLESPSVIPLTHKGMIQSPRWSRRTRSGASSPGSRRPGARASCPCRSRRSWHEPDARLHERPDRPGELLLGGDQRAGRGAIRRPVEEIVRVRPQHESDAARARGADLSAGRFETSLSEYPPSDYRRLSEAAAARYGVAVDEILVGAGADEILDIAAKASCRLAGRP